MKDEKTNQQNKKALYIILKRFTKHKTWLLIFFHDYSSLTSEARYKTVHGEGLKILNHKQMLQRLPIFLAQVNSGYTPENLLNEIYQMIYSLYWAKEITKKVCKNITNLMTI